MPLRDYLTDIFANAFEEIGLSRDFGRVGVSDRPDLGDFQCSGALSAAKSARKNPREVAAKIVEKVRANPVFSEVSIAGAGFINVRLANDFLASALNETGADPRLGCSMTDAPAKTVIDFGGPNVAKPMHVGHLRSFIIGDCLQRVFRFVGNPVTSDIHLGDWGTQMGMIICEARRMKLGPYFDDSYTGEYPTEPPFTIDDLAHMYARANALCKENEAEMAAALEATHELQQGRRGYRALWKQIVDLSVMELHKELDVLDIRFDLWRGESRYQEVIPAMVEDLLARGCAKKSEGATVIFLENTTAEEIPPLIIVKSDGAYLYGTTDLATLKERVEELGAKIILYVVDQRQSLHFKQVFLAARQTGIAKDARMEHIPFGTVNGPDGKPLKSRAGGGTRLRDLIGLVIDEEWKRMNEEGVAQSYPEGERRGIAETVGTAALKFADLMHPITSDYVFEPAKFAEFEGKTGPYLLYASVRIKSILRNAEERGAKAGAILPPVCDVERDLMLMICRLPEAVWTAYEKRAPHFLCDFAYNLSKEFSRFYKDCHILREEDLGRQGSWLSLSTLVLREMELVLSLLGITIPDRM
jgi:arginyl-tRNA synthetase